MSNSLDPIKNPKLIAPCSNEQLRKVKVAADELGVSVADYVRILVLEKIKGASA